jgi:pantothenate kinase
MHSENDAKAPSAQTKVDGA